MIENGMKKLKILNTKKLLRWQVYKSDVFSLPGCGSVGADECENTVHICNGLDLQLCFSSTALLTSNMDKKFDLRFIFEFSGSDSSQLIIDNWEGSACLQFTWVEKH